MHEVLVLIAWVVVTVIIGWSALSLIIRRKGTLDRLEIFALSFPVGLGLVSIQMTCFSALRMEWCAGCILMCWIPVFLAAVYYGVVRVGPEKGGSSHGKNSQLSHLEKFFIFGISFQILYAFFRSFVTPMESHDAVSMYALMAKIFYMAKTVPVDFYSSFKDFVPHIEYPLLLPLSESYFYTFFGSLDDVLVKIIFPLFYVCLLAVFYRVLKHCGFERKGAMLFTFILATIPQVADYATNGYADILLAFYYSAGIFYLYLWTKERKRSFLTISFILSALTVWTKTEGLMLSAVNIFVVLIFMIKERKGFRQGFSYIAVLAIFLLSFLCLKRAMGLEVHGDFAGLVLSDAGKTTIDAVRRVPAILYEYQIQFFGPKKWNIVWIIFLFLFAGRFRKAFKDDIFFITVTMLGIISGYTLIYLIMPRDISWHLSTTASRFFLHFVPVAVLWIALSFKDMKLKI